MKRCIVILLSLLLILTACGKEEQAPAPEPESRSSSASEPVPEPPAPEPEEPAPPEGPTPPPQSEEATDVDIGETPDPGDNPLGETELKNKMTRLGYAIQDWFYSKIPESCYNYYYLYHDGKDFVLVVGVTDEAALDAGLAPWTGEKWDRLVKEPARVSRAQLGELAEAIQKLDVGPVVKINAYVQSSDFYEEIGVSVLLTPKDPEAPPPEDTSRWDQVPKEVEDLAAEYGIPMDLISYRPPVF